MFSPVLRYQIPKFPNYKFQLECRIEHHSNLEKHV